MEKIYMYNLTTEVWGNCKANYMRHAYTLDTPEQNFIHFIDDITDKFRGFKIEEDKNLKSMWSYFIPNIANLIISFESYWINTYSDDIDTIKDELNNDVLTINKDCYDITLLSYGPLTINTGRGNSYIETFKRSGQLGVSIKECERIEFNKSTFDKYCKKLSTDYYKFLNYVIGMFGEVDVPDANEKLIQKANKAPILNELFCLEIKDELDETIIKEKIHPLKISDSNLQKIFNRYKKGSRKTAFSAITDEQKIISYLILSGTASELEEMHTQCKEFINDELLVKNCVVDKYYGNYSYSSTFTKMVNKILQVFALQYIDQIETLGQDIKNLAKDELCLRSIYEHLDLLPANMQLASIIDKDIDDKYYRRELQVYIDKKLILIKPIVDINTLLKYYDSYVKFKQLIYDNIPAGDIIDDTEYNNDAFKWTTKNHINIYYWFNDEMPEAYITYSNNEKGYIDRDECKNLIENYNNLNLDLTANTYKLVFNASILFNQNLDEIKEQISKRISNYFYTLLRNVTEIGGHTIIKEEVADNKLIIYVGNVLTLYDAQFDSLFDDIDEFLYAEIV